VRKLLIAKGLLERSFLKSAQEFENEEFSFGLFCKRTQRVREKKGVSGRWMEGLEGDFNAEGTECPEKRSSSANRGEREGGKPFGE
jgi:hypothetical protein